MAAGASSIRNATIKSLAAFEQLLREDGYTCKTGHVLNVGISFGVLGDTEGFMFDVEDDNYKTYQTFVPLLSAMVDIRLTTLKLDAHDAEARLTMARVLLGQMKLENSLTDGRKLSILFDAVSTPPSRKQRSPMNTTKSKMGQSSRKKKVVEQKLGASQKSMTASASLRGVDLVDPWMDDVDASTAKSASPQPQPALPMGSEDASMEMALQMPQSKTADMTWEFPHNVYVAQITLTGRSYKVTIYEEAGSLLVTAEAPEGTTVPQKLIMQEQHFQALFGVSSLADVAKLSGEKYRQIIESLSVETGPDGLPRLSLPERLALKDEPQSDAISEARSTLKDDGFKTAKGDELQSEATSEAGSTLRDDAFKTANDGTMPTEEQEDSEEASKAEEQPELKGAGHVDPTASQGHKMASDSPVDNPMNATSQVDNPMHTTSQAEKVMNATSQAEKAMGSTTRAENPMTATSQAEKVLGSTSQVDKTMGTTAHVDKPLSATPQVDNPMNATSPVNKTMGPTSQAEGSTSQADKAMSATSQADNPMNAASQLDKAMGSTSQATSQVDKALEPSATAEPSSLPDLPVTGALSLLLHHPMRLGGESLDVQLLQGSADGLMTVRANSERGQGYELLLSDDTLRSLHPPTPDQRPAGPLLPTLSPSETAALCVAVLDRLDLSSSSSLKMRKELLLRRRGCHVPLRSSEWERAKILHYSGMSTSLGHSVDDQLPFMSANHDLSVSTNSMEGESRPSTAEVNRGVMSANSSVSGVTLSSGEGAHASVVSHDGSQESLGASDKTLWLRARRFEPEGTVLVVSMRDEGQGVRVVGQEMGPEGGTHEVAKVGEDVLRALLGPKRTYPELSLDQRIELCGKLHALLDFDSTQKVLQLSAPPAPSEEEQEGWDWWGAVTLLTRGATLGSPFAMVVSFKDMGTQGTLLVEAQDALHPEVKPRLSLAASELADFGCADFGAMALEEKEALCERVLAGMELLLTEEGSGRMLLLDPPNKRATHYKTATLVLSAAEPPLLGTSPEPHPPIPLPKGRRRRREQGHKHEDRASGTPDRPSDIHADLSKAPVSSVLFSTTRRLGGGDCVVDVLRIPPLDAVVQVRNVGTGQTHFLLLDAALLKVLKAAGSQRQEAGGLWGQVVSRLAMVGGRDGKARLALRIEHEGEEGWKAEGEVLASRSAEGEEGVGVAVVDGGETIVIVASRGDREVRQWLSSSDLASLDCLDFGYLDHDEKVGLAQRAIASLSQERLAAAVEGTHADVPAGLADYVRRRFPSSDVAPGPLSVQCADVHQLGLGKEVQGRGYAASLKEHWEGGLSLLFEDPTNGVGGFDVPVTEADCRHAGLPSLAAATRAENRYVAGHRLVGGLGVRVVMTCDGRRLSALPRSLALLDMEEQRSKIEYVFTKDDHVIREQSYDISVMLDGPSQLRVQAERLGSEEVLELVLAGVMTLSLLVKGGKVVGLSSEKRQSLGRKLLDGLDVVDDKLSFGIRRAARTVVCSNTRADVMSVPVPANPHVKRYLHVLDMLTHQDVEAEAAGTDGHCVPQSPSSPLESGIRTSLTVRSATPNGVVRNADEMLGVKRNYIGDPYAEVLSHKHSSMVRFRHKGLKSRRFSYVDYWEAKVEAVLEYFRCEQSLRKAISIIRRAQGQVYVSNREAFCALAATDGSVTEACGKLSHAEFHKEIQLVCKIIDLDKYRRVPLATRASTASSLAPLPPPLGRFTVTAPSPSASVRSLSAAMPPHSPHRRLSTTPLGINRRASSALANASPCAAIASTQQHPQLRGKSSHRLSIMDITRSDFESLFAPSLDTCSLSTIGSRTSASGRPSFIVRPMVSGGLPQERISISSASVNADSTAGSRRGSHHNRAPSGRLLRRQLSTTLKLQREVDIEELRRLASTVKELTRVYPTPLANRPYTSNGVCKGRVEAAPGFEGKACPTLYYSGLVALPPFVVKPPL